jgi:hypothetical protein
VAPLVVISTKSGLMACGEVVPNSLLVATEKFVKVFMPNVHPVTPAVLSAVIVSGTAPQTNNDAKLSDDKNVVAKTRSSVLFSIVVT